ncbi:MAG: hypothetical protein ABW020_04795 [Candidatus Rokuibacteriota bacterium]
MRPSAAGLGLAAALLALPSLAIACTCAQPPTPQAGLESAERVFLGVVERFEVEGARRVATFRVGTVWKGPRQARITVTTGGGDGDCGVHFVAGREYLVYAGQGRQARLETSICTRTAWIKDARDDMRSLGPGSGVPGPGSR